MPNLVGPLFALLGILAFLYFAFLRSKRADPSGRRDEDHAATPHVSHHVDSNQAEIQLGPLSRNTPVSNSGNDRIRPLAILKQAANAQRHQAEIMLDGVA